MRRAHIGTVSGDSRQEIVDYYLRRITDYRRQPNAKRVEMQPACWERHRNAGEEIPLDWPHTLAVLYRVRCNLFHGEKARHSEMDQRIVHASFRVLVEFFDNTGYLV